MTDGPSAEPIVQVFGAALKRYPRVSSPPGLDGETEY